MKFSPSLLYLKPYESGKSVDTFKREKNNKSFYKIIKLASNENYFAYKFSLSLINKCLEDINRYPDSSGYELKKIISDNILCLPEQIILGNGSNEVLEILARSVLFSSKQEAIFSQYSFPIYFLITQSLGVKQIITQADNYGHNLDNMLKAISDNTKIIFIANPNNPTGTIISDNKIKFFLSQIPSDILVVIDQAYYEYTDSNINVSLISKYPNLVLTRSFSKAYSLAGLRVGYSISTIKIADYINKLRQPFNVNSLGQKLASVVLQDKDFLQDVIKKNKIGKNKLQYAFSKMGLDYIDSYTNFICVSFKDSNLVYKKLLDYGVIVRPVGVKNYLRITIGSDSENDYLLSCLKKII